MIRELPSTIQKRIDEVREQIRQDSKRLDRKYYEEENIKYRPCVENSDYSDIVDE